ncbi:hypothetical protein [Chlamydiifrater phoenicopteri]|uniref:hypothetical protein n=1 Tax=Chlamydiifrater phoenicopteri TaxID=2681469 RepID=UPI001BCD218F|nr:hypothetical protein [Chlamydiifrater phoenicopteri]
MSVPKPSGVDYSEKQARVSLSLSERISANAATIRELTSSPLFFPLPPNVNPEREVLRSQLFAIKAEGFSLSLMAKAMTISGVFLKTIVKEQTALTEAQYQQILASCKDLTEASGSSAPLSIPPGQELSLPQLSEQTGVSEQEIPSSEELPILTEQRIQTTESLSLPLKKRKTWQVFFATERPALREKIGETLPQTPPSPPPEQEKKLTRISLALDALFLSKEADPAFTVACPRRQGRRKHKCSLCKIAHSLVSSKTNALLIQQLKTLLLYIPKPALARTLLSLHKENKIPSILETNAFSRLEAAHIASKCNLEKELCPSGSKSPIEHLTIYQSMKDVVKSGLEDPLTSAINKLWDSGTIVGGEEKVLIEKDDGETTLLSPSDLTPLFSSLTTRGAFRSKRRDKILPLHPSYVNFVAKATIRSLQALKRSPLGTPYLIQTSPGKSAIKKHVVKHIYSIILATNSTWKIEIPPCLHTEATTQILSFSDLELASLVHSLKNFVDKNHIEKPKNQPLVVPSEHQLRKRDASALIQESALLEEEEGIEEIPSREAPRKRRAKTLHKSVESPESTSELFQEPESPSRSFENLTLAQIYSALSFFINFALENKGKQVLIMYCPFETSEERDHICKQCFLAKRVFQRKALALIAQIERFLSYTSKELLIKALAHLFSDCGIKALGECHSLSNIEIALLLKNCNVGDNVCLPGIKNPASQAELYYHMEKVISSGLTDPLTSAILETWEKSSKIASSEDEEPSISILQEDGSIATCNLPYLHPILSSIAYRYFIQKEANVVRGKIFYQLSEQTTTFFAKTTIYTLKALTQSPLAVPYLSSSPSGLLFPWSVVRHVLCLVLSSNPLRKVVVLPSKISPKASQDLSLSQEELEDVLPSLQRFTKINKLFLPGKSLFSKKKF